MFLSYKLTGYVKYSFINYELQHTVKFYVNHSVENDKLNSVFDYLSYFPAPPPLRDVE